MKNIFIFKLLFLAILFAVPMLTFAQGPPDPNDVPIDGGLGLLLAAGVVYGVKKFRDVNKNQENVKI